MTELVSTTRVRQSPYFEAVTAAGVTGVMPYNRMWLPVGYGDPEGEYRRLTTGVSMWDVGCERQIELKGPDAARLAQILSPRKLDGLAVGQGKYVALCDHRGVMINDPVLLKVAEDCFWFSIADSDVVLWARAIGAERGLDVGVTEADVAPLAIQGPKAEDVVASMFGDWVRKLRFFWFADAVLGDIQLKVARSGWSKQGGFELYLMDGSRGRELWNRVAEAGAPWGIAPGSPNASERIESGLLSFGGDTDDATNPFEVGMTRFVDLDAPDDVVGIDALRRIAAEGPARHQLGIVLDGDQPQPGHDRWYRVVADGEPAGAMTNGTWSYKLERNIGFGLVPQSCRPGDRIEVLMPDGPRPGWFCDIPFTVEARNLGT